MLQASAGNESTMTPERATLSSRASNTPPPAPRVHLHSLSRVLRMDNLQQLRRLFELDDNIVHVPLTDRGCDPPVLSAVVHRCCPEIIGFLLRHGATVHGHDLEGFTALHHLAMGGEWHWHLENRRQSMHLVNPLLNFLHFPHAEVDHIMASAPPPLHLPPPPWADALATMPPNAQAEERSCAVAIWLLTFGADPLGEDANGLTAVDLANRSKQPKLAFLLSQWPSRKPMRVLRECLARGAALESESAGSFKHLLPGLAEHIFDFVMPCESCSIWGRAAHHGHKA